MVTESVGGGSDKDADTAFIATGFIPQYYARFGASMYSVEHSLPGINLGIASNWSSNTTADCELDVPDVIRVCPFEKFEIGNEAGPHPHALLHLPGGKPFTPTAALGGPF